LDKKIIGIDFSPNSSGFCILKKDSCKLISVIRTSNVISKMYLKEGSAIKTFKDLELVSINIIPKKNFNNNEYHIKEKEKMIDSINFSNFILELLNPYLDENTYISMEGLSFNSSSNFLIDVSMTTSLIRSKIIEKINPNNFFVFSPTTIKKFVIKGNAKKDLLYTIFIEKKKDDLRFSKIIQILTENKDKWIKSSKKVEIPCSDIIDSIWLSLFLEENLEKLFKSMKI